MTKDEERFSSIEIAAYLGITPGTLRNWRTERAGPPWHTLRPKKRGKGRGSRPRVYYVGREVLAWIEKGKP